MRDEDLIIRTMTRQEIDLAIDWAAAEGWNPGIHDAECFHVADPGGFFIGLVNAEPVAVISAVRYGRSFGFIGLYIVKPGYRGKGYGIRVWNAGLEHLAHRNAGLDGVVEQQGNYSKSGFKLAYRNIRYEGRGTAGGSSRPDVVTLSSLPFETIESYDRPFFPGSRTQFLECWINQPQAKALGVMRDGGLAGYGVLRRCRSGHKIGPLFADDPALAESLFLSLSAGLEPGEPVYLDVPQVNARGIALAERHGMSVVFETARMYRGGEPQAPLDRIFGLTTFELG